MHSHAPIKESTSGTIAVLDQDTALESNHFQLTPENVPPNSSAINTPENATSMPKAELPSQQRFIDQLGNGYPRTEQATVAADHAILENSTSINQDTAPENNKSELIPETLPPNSSEER